MPKIGTYCTKPARQVWRHLFPGEPWPRGWRVRWQWLPIRAGNCSYGRRFINLCWANYHRDPVATLCHEFIHVRCRGLRHGKEFRHIERELLSRLGL